MKSVFVSITAFLSVALLAASCNSAFTAVTSSSITRPSTTTATPTTSNPPSSPKSPPMIQCGQGFFSSSQIAALGSQFGLTTCFRFSTSNVWIVIGDGMSLTSQATPPSASPGGSIVAALGCAASDANCLRASGQHDFTNFNVSYPPVPLNGRMELQQTSGTDLLTFNVGNCGLFGFNIQNGKWYGGTAAEINALISDASRLSPISVPGSTTGQIALSSPAPPPVSADCTE